MEKEAGGFNLERYLSAGVEKVVREMLKASALHPRENRFLAQYALASRKAASLRRQAEARGEHVPPFLIASITNVCNLRCAGCYAHALHACGDGAPPEQMTAEEWARVFAQAKEMGIGFILLAGGEPMVRADVLARAAQVPQIVFPVFTNGTMLTDETIALLDRCRNLIPILSIEGGREQTDARRGDGIYDRVADGMRRMREKRIAFGASVTVTSENLGEVTSDAFLSRLAEAGCKAVVFVEFVPTDERLRNLALDDAQREALASRLAALRAQDAPMLLISFPGDEKSSGGCLAAGRGFFHINARGGAEPCPFSPYSDFSVREHTLREAMDSPLFCALREEGFLTQVHEGGCALYEQRAQVEALLGAQDERLEA